MPRALTVPEVVFANQRHKGEGQTLTRKRAANIATDILTEQNVTRTEKRSDGSIATYNASHECQGGGALCPTCARAGQLLAHAANSLLKSKRSKAKGHPNGKRNYSGRDRRAVAPAGAARLHGSKVGVRV